MWSTLHLMCTVNSEYGFLRRFHAARIAIPLTHPGPGCVAVYRNTGVPVLLSCSPSPLRLEAVILILKTRQKGLYFETCSLQNTEFFRLAWSHIRHICFWICTRKGNVDKHRWGCVYIGIRWFKKRREKGLALTARLRRRVLFSCARVRGSHSL